MPARIANFGIVAVLVASCSVALPSATRSNHPRASATPLESSPTPTPSVPSSVESPAIPADGEWLACLGAGYAVAYPAGWFVHEPDQATGAAECALFAAKPFAGQSEEDGGWTGAQIVLAAGEGCIGTFETRISERQLEIDHYPAWARDFAAGEGPNAGRPVAYQYFVNVSPDQPCESGRWFIGRTEIGAPGEHFENKAILDRMMSSLRLFAP